MSSVVRMSEASALGLHAMVHLAERPPEGARPFVTVPQIAASLSASVTHLQKVMRRLSCVGLVRAVRGPRGGFALAKDPGEITLLAIFEALEGELSLNGCLFSQPVCDRLHCIMGGVIERVNTEVRDYMARTTLAELTRSGSATGARQ